MADDFLPPLIAKLGADISSYIDGLRDAERRMDEFVAHQNAALESIHDARVKVTADADGLRAEVDRAVAAAGAGQNINVDVKADTSHIGPDVSSGIHAEHGRFEGDGEDAGRVMGRGANRGFASEFSKMNLGSTGMFSNLVPFIIPAIAAVGALSGALALVPALAFAAGTALGSIVVGTRGITDAVSAYTKSQDTAGTSAASSAAQQLASANSIISAQEGVKHAIEAVADAQRNAANSIISAQQAVTDAIEAVATAQRTTANTIISAEQAVTTAVRAAAAAEVTATTNVRTALAAQQRAEESLQAAQVSALRAQQNLTDARLAASRSIEDLQSRVTDDALAQRAAVAGVEEAQRVLTATQSNPYASSQSIAAAQLAYDQAQQQLHNISISYERSKVDAAAAATAGVEGSKQVVSAQDGVLASQKALRDTQTAVSDAAQHVTEVQLAGAEQIEAANQRVADTQRALTNAQITGAEQVAAANQRVETTQRALVNAQISGAEQVQHAQEAVITAQRNLTQAIAAAAAASASAAAKVNEFDAAMAKLSPSAQAFVRELIALKPAWDALRLDVQQRLFAGLDTQLAHLGAVALPVLRTGLAKMATSINENITQFTEWATSAKTVADMDRIFDNSAVAAHNLAGAVKPVQDILRDITVVASEFLPGLASGFAAAAQRAADFIRQARESGKLREWIQAGITAVGQLMSILGDLIKIIARVTAAPGPNLLTVLKAITSSFLWLVTNVPGLIPVLEALFVAWKLAQVAQGIIAVTETLKLAAAATKIWAAAQWILNIAMDANPIGILILAIAAIGVAIYLLWTHCEGFRDFFIAMWNWIQNAADAVGRWFTSVFVSYFTGPFQAILGAAQWALKSVVDLFWWMVDNATRIPGMILGVFGSLGKMLWDMLYNAGRDLVLGLWHGLQSLAGWLWDSLVAWAKSMWDAVKGAFGISSPSTLAAEDGKNLVLGLQRGITTHAHLAVAAATSMASRVAGALSGATSTTFPALSEGMIPAQRGALAVRTGSGSGPAPVHITVHVAGSVLSEGDLAQVVRQQFLRHGIRNTSNGASYSFA